MEDQTIEDAKMEKGHKKPSSDGSNDSDAITEPSPEEGQVQTDAADNEVPTEDIDHGDVGEQPPQQVPAVPPVLRRSDRDCHSSKRYNPQEYKLLTDASEPESYRKVEDSDQKQDRLKAMQDEMDSLKKNHTYDLVKLPKGKKPLKNRWVFKLKQEKNGTKPRYKARLAVKGYNQRKEEDFQEIFSPVVKMASIRVVFGLAASLDLEIEQLDVKTAFLHGDLHEEIYMEQPEGFAKKSKKKLVCKLKKSLYGLKQAPRQWYRKFDAFMKDQVYNRLASDHCVCQEVRKLRFYHLVDLY